jgi:hypothetical protein
MPDENDDIFEGEDKAADELEQLTEALFAHISAFAEEQDVDDEILSLLLLRLALTTRMGAYAMSVAKPSGGGLRLDLDRFRRDVEDIVRAAKKDADRFIATAREAIAAADLEEDDGT